MSDKLLSREDGYTRNGSWTLEGRGIGYAVEKPKSKVNCLHFLRSKQKFFNENDSNPLIPMNDAYIDGTAKYNNIIQGVDFYARAGQLTAIMGPSGAGKTTLLNVLAGRHAQFGTRGKTHGEIFLNGIQQSPRNLMRSSCFVLQKDCLSECLTVQEVLDFTAELALCHLSSPTRRERVNRLIEELRLQHCRNSRIGGETMRGISPGELKRTCIAVALLRDPPIVFLDEPTSGLDSSLAFDVLLLLSRLACRGRTIVCTIHQPSSSMFGLFDHLVLLSTGKLVFQGHPSHVCTYFSELGYNCPDFMNPADFVLDLLVPSSLEYAVEKTESDSKLINNSPDIITVESNSKLDTQAKEIHSQTPLFLRRNLEIKINQSLNQRIRLTVEEIQQLPSAFANSQAAIKLRDGAIKMGEINTLGNIENTGTVEEREMVVDMLDKTSVGTGTETWVTPNARDFCHFSKLFSSVIILKIRRWINEVIILFKREMLNSSRHPMWSWGSLLGHIALALLLGGIWFQMRTEEGKPTNFYKVGLKGGVKLITEEAKIMASDFRNTCGALFLVSTLIGFSAMAALVAFHHSRVVLNRETAGGLYSVSSYFVAKVIADLPFQHIPVTVFLCIFYWMTGLKPAIVPFFRYLIIGNVSVFAATGSSYLIGGLSHDQQLTLLIAPTFTVLCMLVGGFFINVRDLPCWISWVQHLSFIKHSFAAFASNQFPSNEAYGFLQNDQWLEALGVMEVSVNFSFIMLIILGSTTRFIAFFLLKYTNRTIGLQL